MYIPIYQRKIYLNMIFACAYIQGNNYSPYKTRKTYCTYIYKCRIMYPSIRKDSLCSTQKITST